MTDLTCLSKQRTPLSIPLVTKAFLLLTQEKEVPTITGPWASSFMRPVDSCVFWSFLWLSFQWSFLGVFCKLVSIFISVPWLRGHEPGNTLSLPLSRVTGRSQAWGLPGQPALPAEGHLAWSLVTVSRFFPSKEDVERMTSSHKVWFTTEMPDGPLLAFSRQLYELEVEDGWGMVVWERLDLAWVLLA